MIIEILELAAALEWIAQGLLQLYLHAFMQERKELEADAE